MEEVNFLLSFINTVITIAIIISSTTPVRQVTCPVLLYWGAGDWLAQPRGVARIADQLPNLVDSVRVISFSSYSFYVLGITVSVLIVVQLMLQVAHGQWNHLDFLWGRDVRTLLYDQIIAVSILFVLDHLSFGKF